MSLFVIDIGNTNTRFGMYSEAEGLCDSSSIPTSELTSAIVPEKTLDVAIASVVPRLTSIFDDFSPFVVSSDNRFSVDFSAVDISTLGADRIANAAALASSADLPAICVDCGTAVTVEGVDRDGRFVSGAIAPGRMLFRKALNSHTAQLPLVAITHCELSPPPVFSCNTVGAILAGCDIGALGMVREFVDHARSWNGFADCKVFVAGGDSDYFAANIDGVENVGPDFTLSGIAAIYLFKTKGSC
ncbi:MAG: type III pantothenate kinase [Victivallales bacterium]|nr:type III pantothenate kinase [Victivallales bacterium]